MAKFSYTIQKSDASRAEGSLEAADLDAARETLARDGVVLKLVESRGPAPGWPGGRVSRRELLGFTRELAALLRGGVPMARALGLLTKNSRSPALKKALAGVSAKIVGGLALHAALRAEPRAFPPLYCSMVETAEASGKLVAVLKRLAGHEQARLKLEARVRAALVYPAVVLVITMGLILFFSLQIIPSFARVFDSFGLQLPLATRAVMALSAFLVAYFPLLATGGLALAVVGRGLLGTEPGLRVWVSLKSATPVLGGLYRGAMLERCFSVLALLLSNGVQMLPALKLLEAGLVDDPALRDAVGELSRRVASGAALSAAMRASGAFPEETADTVATGEESGSLSESLENLEAYHHEQVELRLERFTTILEPVLLVLVGAVVGALLFSLFMPIFQLSTLKPT